MQSDVADVRGALVLFVPLPFSRRHTLSLGLRARAAFHGEPSRLLEIGGAQGDTLFARPGTEDHEDYPGLPPKRRFREPLRGFETDGFTTDRIGIIDLRYLYPIIIDRGTATTLFPARAQELETTPNGAAGGTDHQ